MNVGVLRNLWVGFLEVVKLYLFLGFKRDIVGKDILIGCEFRFFFFILILDQMNNFKSFMCAKLCIIGIKILDHLSLWTKFIWGHIGSFMSMSIYMSMSIHLTVWMGNLPANFCKEISDVQTSRKLGELIFNIGLLFLAITLKRGRFLPHNVKHPSYFLQNLLFPIIGVDWKWDIYMVQTFWYLTHKPLSFLKI